MHFTGVKRIFEGLRTGFSNADSDISALQRGSLECKGLFQPFNGGKLDVAKTLWRSGQFVLDYANTADFTFGE